MKRRILLVDDDVAVLLTLKAVLEISGFDVETAASAREGKSKLRSHEYHMIITDMRMESDASGIEVIEAARSATYHPAVALLTAFPIAEEDWQSLGADKMLVKPMHTRILLQQIENLLASHEGKLKIWTSPAPRAGVADMGVAGSSAGGKTSGGKTSGAKTAGAKQAAGRALGKQGRGVKPKAGKAPAKESGPKQMETKRAARASKR
jgi:DNA-binding response OmpR family regulator